MRSLLKFLRPAAYIRRRAVYAGLLGGNRKWLMFGGMVWGLHWLGRIVGAGEPTAVFTQELDPGERFVVVHGEKPTRRRRGSTS
ncbi:MAG: hypothetical protein OEU32_10070 [Acidimicrobiia bacterium]|nr:hypothetical protein [Acidimicrobiia bacterium]